MDKKIIKINKEDLRKIIIRVHNQLKIGRTSDIPSSLLADTIIDNIEILFK